MKPDTFTILSDALCREIGANGAVICGKVITLCGEQNTPCELSNDYLCELLNISLHTLLDLLNLLQKRGYIIRNSSRGRGCVSTYQKGAEIAGFIIPKKVQKLQVLDTIKGAEIAPKYNNIINNNKEKNILLKKENSQIMAKFKKPTLAELQEYCEARANGIDAQAFLDYYESKGWLIGKSPMKDWRAAVRTWERREKENNQKQVRYGRANYTPADAARAIELGIALADAERANS